MTAPRRNLQPHAGHRPKRVPSSDGKEPVRIDRPDGGQPRARKAGGDGRQAVDPVAGRTNSAFERAALARFTGRYLPPEEWEDTMILAAYNGLPMSLDAAGDALRLRDQKIKEGAALIRYFCTPCAPTVAGGGRTRNRPEHVPDKWARFIEYCRRDVEVTQAIYYRLNSYPVTTFERRVWALDARINERGVPVDVPMVEAAPGDAPIQAAAADGAGKPQQRRPAQKLAEMRRAGLWEPEQGGRDRSAGADLRPDHPPRAGAAAAAGQDQHQEIPGHARRSGEGPPGARHHAVLRRGAHRPVGRAAGAAAEPAAEPPGRPRIGAPVGDGAGSCDAGAGVRQRAGRAFSADPHGARGQTRLHLSRLRLFRHRGARDRLPRRGTVADGRVRAGRRHLLQFCLADVQGARRQARHQRPSAAEGQDRGIGLRLRRRGGHAEGFRCG